MCQTVEYMPQSVIFVSVEHAYVLTSPISCPAVDRVIIPSISQAMNIAQRHPGAIQQWIRTSVRFSGVVPLFGLKTCHSCQLPH